MFKLIIKIAAGCTLLAVATFFVVPTRTDAGPMPSFGGYNWVQIPCTCSYALNWNYFFPFYYQLSPEGPIIPPPPAMAPGMVVQLYGPTIFSNYYLGAGQWGSGFFEPGPTGSCLIGVTPYCVVLPDEGFITPFSGSSPPTPYTT